MKVQITKLSTIINHLLLLLLVIQLINVNGYLEVALERKQEDIVINIQKIVSMNPNVKRCSQDILQYKYNTTAFTQMCYHKDLTFNVQTLIGDVNFNYEIATLAIDLHSPISWLKQVSCKSCSNDTPIPTTLKAAYNLTCENSCLFNEVQTDYIVTNKYRQKKHSSIISNDKYLYGEYITSRFSFLAYDPTKKKSMFRYIEEELQKDTFEKYEDLITFPSLKMVAASKLIGYNNFPGDGVIGLGLNKVYKGDTKAETNTDIMEALVSAYQSIDNRIFGIYINEIGDTFKDYVLILGGINTKYSHQNFEEIQYVKANENTSYYWNLPVEKISFHIPSIDVNYNGVKDKDNFNVIQSKSKSAILSLSTTFIALPKDELNQLINIINRFGKTDCKIVDSTYMAVYCRNIRTESIQTMEVTFEFTGGVRLTLDYKQLLRQCQIDIEYETDDRDNNDCLLNFQLSPTNNIILGEPFLKKHYTVFDQTTMQVGFLPAADNTYWRKEFYESPSYVKYLIRIVIAIFIVGMLFIVCIAQIMRFTKWFKRKWRGEDEGHYTEKVSFANQRDDISYDDIELTMRQQAMNELKNQQNEFNDDNTSTVAHTQQYQDETLDIEDHVEQNIQNQFNSDFPSIPQPPVKQADLIDVEQPKPFDDGFNFVQGKNPFDQPEMSINLKDDDNNGL